MAYKAPFLKKVLSYFGDVQLEAVRGDINDYLQVCLSKGRLRLDTPNAIYSYDDLYNIYEDAFTHLKIGRKKVKSCLILGFGLGSIPFILNRKASKKIHYTGVEIDETIIHLFHKYRSDEVKHLSLVNADAKIFMHSNSQKYDLICVDLFIDSYVPEEFDKLQFVEQLKNALNPKGIICWNRLYNKRYKERVDEFLNGTFKKVFPNAYDYHTHGNMMIIENGHQKKAGN